jgi:hypothetical protein
MYPAPTVEHPPLHSALHTRHLEHIAPFQPAAAWVETCLRPIFRSHHGRPKMNFVNEPSHSRCVVARDTFASTEKGLHVFLRWHPCPQVSYNCICSQHHMIILIRYTLHVASTTFIAVLFKNSERICGIVTSVFSFKVLRGKRSLFLAFRGRVQPFRSLQQSKNARIHRSGVIVPQGRNP